MVRAVRLFPASQLSSCYSKNLTSFPLPNTPHVATIPNKRGVAMKFPELFNYKQTFTLTA